MLRFLLGVRTCIRLPSAESSHGREFSTKLFVNQGYPALFALTDCTNLGEYLSMNISPAHILLRLCQDSSTKLFVIKGIHLGEYLSRKMCVFDARVDVLLDVLYDVLLELPASSFRVLFE